jgi:hypothetical protein
VKNVQTLPGVDINSDHNILVATICTSLKKIIMFHKRKPRWDLEKLYAVEGKLGAIKCEVGMWKCSGAISRNVC